MHINVRDFGVVVSLMHSEGVSVGSTVLGKGLDPIGTEGSLEELFYRV